MLGKLGAEDLHQLGAVGLGGGSGGVVGVVHQILTAQLLEESVVIAVGLQDAHVEPLVIGALERIHNGRAGVLAGLGVLVAVLGGHHAGALAPDGLGEEGDHDLAALAGLGLLVEGRADAAGQGAGGGGVAEADEGVHGGGLLLGDVDHGAGAGPEGHGVKAGVVLGGTEIAEAVDLSPDEVGVLLAQRAVVQAQALEGAGAVAGHKDIGGLQELVQDGLALVALQVEGEAPLVGVVGGVEGIAVLHGGAGHGSAGAPAGIAETGLHLDDVGAPVGQDAGGAGAGHEVGEINDFHAL